MLVCHYYRSVFIFYTDHGKSTQPGYSSCQWLMSSIPEEDEADWHTDVRKFITAKQFETISLHSLSQNLRINDFRWLHEDIGSGQRVVPGEMKKRKELVLSLIHWIFECFLVPLIKVSTESVWYDIRQQRIIEFILCHWNGDDQIRDSVLLSEGLEQGR